MLKAAFILFLGLLLFQKADAQKITSDKDTVLYYLTNSGNLTQKDSADYVLFIMPRNTDDKNSLYPIAEFYADGKRKLIGSSHTQSLKLNLEGPCISFFPNGHRKSVITYKGNYPDGNIINYYPNGQLYSITKYGINFNLLFMECRDSTGKVLAENGNGKWIEFNDNFKMAIREGLVNHGYPQGKWNYIPDSVRYAYYNKTGDIIKNADVQPAFNGGSIAFYRYLAKTVRYPAEDRENNVQGKVLISFVVEKDGYLTHFEAISGPSVSLKEAALKGVESCPPWKPGSLNGITQRVRHTIPVNFTLAGNN